MSDSKELSLADRILGVVTQRQANGEGYTTVRTASKLLGAKQKEIQDNLPEGYMLIPSQNGALSEYRIEPKPEGILSSADEVLPQPEEKPKVQKMKPKSSRKEKVMSEQEIAEMEMDGEVTSTEESAAESAEPREVCIVCGNPVRKTTETIRGVCPLCFRQLVKNSGMSTKQLQELSDEEFQAVVGEELGRRRSLEEYKASRQLTAEEFKERESELIPVKEVFAAAKEAGFGQGRVAQAMGGDRFRHEPLGGFGSVWTPYFVGARKSWYFDSNIINNFEDLRKPVKAKKEKTEKTPRDGSRGKKMTPVAATEESVAEASA